MLCTAAQLKTRLGITAATQDTLLAQLITGVSGQMQGAAGCNRPLLSDEREETQIIDLAAWTVMYLRIWPVEAVDELLVRYAGSAWTDAEELVEDDDWSIDLATGRVELFSSLGPCSVRVTYTAGYVGPVAQAVQGFTLAVGETLLPDEIVEAALRQCGNDYQRRLDPSRISEGVAQASQAYAATLGPAELLPGVAEILQSAKYRRHM